MKGFPPRAKNRKPGAVQIGLLVRTDEGVIEVVWNDAALETKKVAGQLFLTQFPEIKKPVDP